MSLEADVRAAVERGDAERVRDLLVAANERERRALARQVDGWWHEYDKSRRLPRMVALLGTATARQIATWWWSFDDDPRQEELGYDVLAARGRAFFETLTRNLVSDGVQAHWKVVRRAVREGLIDRPKDGDAYVRGMVARLGDWRNADSVYDALLADPELLDTELWAIFEVDCSGELANANTFVLPEPGTASVRGESLWMHAFRRLDAEGRVDRQRLLDASLDALLRDFRPSMVGWFAQLHEALEPTEAERRARIETYLALLGSPASSVVKEGLAALRLVEPHVAAPELAAVAIGPLAQKQKNLAMEMLRLLERAAARDADSRPVVLEAAAQALGHERADVQERSLALLEKYRQKAPRAALLAFGDAVAPQLRSRVEALTGIASAGVPEERVELPLVWPEPVQPRMTVERLRSDVTALEPVASVDELIELAASLLQGQGTGDDAERFLDGVSRLCNERPKGFKRRTAGIVKQLGVPFASDLSGAWLIASVVQAWVERRKPRSERPSETMLGFLGRRAFEVAGRAARGHARPLLAFPTHAGGWIDPEVLAERERSIGRFRNRPDAADRLQASLRAFPLLEHVRYTPSVRMRAAPVMELVAETAPPALGDLQGLVGQIGRASDHSIWLSLPPWGSWDALGARWSLTVLPTLPDAAFAGAAVLIGWTLDLAPQLYPDVVLQHALDPNVPLGEPAWIALGGGLVAKSPDLHRVSTDVLVASVDDGRFDADRLGGALAWLVGSGFAKVARLQAPLRDAGRASPLHAAQMVRLAEGFLARLDGPSPAGLHAPLEVVLEHATRTGYRIDRPDARAALERIGAGVSSSSKLGRIVRGLLDGAIASR